MVKRLQGSKSAAAAAAAADQTRATLPWGSRAPVAACWHSRTARRHRVTRVPCHPDRDRHRLCRGRVHLRRTSTSAGTTLQWACITWPPRYRLPVFKPGLHRWRCVIRWADPPPTICRWLLCTLFTTNGGVSETCPPPGVLKTFTGGSVITGPTNGLTIAVTCS